MKSTRGRDTGPELAVRSELHRRGLRYRVNLRPEPALRRTADVIFTRAKIAVFIDGCFWHSCPVHATSPKRNGEFWAAKLERNRQRDAETNAALTAGGWTVLRFWEHEDPVDIADRVEQVVHSLR
jgi:DNA mismatch endonuclease (patch repair protein)